MLDYKTLIKKRTVFRISIIKKLVVFVLLIAIGFLSTYINAVNKTVKDLWFRVETVFADKISNYEPHIVKKKTLTQRKGIFKKTAITAPVGSKKFNFYNILPEIDFDISSGKTESYAKNAKYDYVLQIFSTKSRREAVELSKKLQKLNITTYVDSYGNNHKWYRVVLYSSSNLNEAKKNQYMIYKKYGIKGLILKNKSGIDEND